MEYVAHRTAALRLHYGTELFIFVWFPTCKTILDWARRFEAGVSVTHCAHMVLLKLRDETATKSVHVSVFGKNLVP